MKQLLTIVSISISLFISGCSTTNGVKANEVVEATDIGVTESTPNSTTPQNDKCRICDPDLSKYSGPLGKEEIDGLHLALNDEYMAIGIYQKVNQKFNSPRPFVNIVEAEKRHADRLTQLFVKYGLTVPQNPWTENVQEFKDLKQACEASVQAEIVNRDLYTKLFGSTKRADITQTYKDLQAASENNHLPAFERCSSGSADRPRGGRGMGRGPGGGL